jgi:hypothetical protein
MKKTILVLTLALLASNSQAYDFDGSKGPKFNLVSCETENGDSIEVQLGYYRAGLTFGPVTILLNDELYLGKWGYSAGPTRVGQGTSFTAKAKALNGPGTIELSVYQVESYDNGEVLRSNEYLTFNGQKPQNINCELF